MQPRSVNDPFLSTSLQLVLAALVVAWTGCCGPYIRSQQSAYLPASEGHIPHPASGCGKGIDCAQGCYDGQLKLGLPQPILQAISGPFVPHEIVDPYQSTMHPPHSKFHPIPTRPVFTRLRETSTPGPVRSGFMPQPCPTCVIPPAGRPTLAPQESEPRSGLDDPRRDERPQETSR